mmetsp:Transcript_65175/g.155595  ORF Transcript_65175/g.155595 Transcript_65175/m.155595 type:complete len:100 (-) Transcript_65175:1781-2080(-)
MADAANSSIVLQADFKSAAFTFEADALCRASLSDAATKIVRSAPATGKTTSLLENRTHGCKTDAKATNPTKDNVRNQELLVNLVRDRISFKFACTLLTA